MSGFSYLDPNYFFRYSRQSVDAEDVYPLVSSIDNYFVPIFAGIDGKKIKSGIHKALVYNIKQRKRISGSTSIPRTIRQFTNTFHDYGQYTIFNDVDHPCYYTMKHFIYIYDQDQNVVPLYALCYSRQDIFNVKPPTYREPDMDFSKMFLLLSRQFLDPVHKKMYTKIKVLIKYFEEQGVNIMYVNDINALCFNSENRKMDFPTMEKRMEYVEQLKSQLGLYGRPKPVAPVTQQETPAEITQPPTGQVTASSGNTVISSTTDSRTRIPGSVQEIFQEFQTIQSTQAFGYQGGV